MSLFQPLDQTKDSLVNVILSNGFQHGHLESKLEPPNYMKHTFVLCFDGIEIFNKRQLETSNQFMTNL